MRIDWLGLPKLTTLRTTSSSYTFAYPRHITLESDSHPLWMMFRHAQSHRCVSSMVIRAQEWRHNQRQYSLHPSLTNRHRSSCKSSKSLIEARDSSLCATHNYFPSTSELIRRHLRERYRCANTEMMTIRIWNDGNPIRIVETRSNDHSLQIACNQRHFTLQITHIASSFKWETNPNHSVIHKEQQNTHRTVYLTISNSSQTFKPQFRHNYLTFPILPNPAIPKSYSH